MLNILNLLLSFYKAIINRYCIHNRYDIYKKENKLKSSQPLAYDINIFETKKLNY